MIVLIFALQYIPYAVGYSDFDIFGIWYAADDFGSALKS